MTDEPERPLRDQIKDLLDPMATGHDGWDDKLADAIMQLLVDEGHYVPGAPIAAQMFADVRDFAQRLKITELALRILNMLAFSTFKTPETKPALQWITDYLEGKNHGPPGKPMLWPANLPGIASMLRDWGFMPTPTVPAFVAKAPAVTVLDAGPTRVQ